MPWLGRGPDGQLLAAFWISPTLLSRRVTSRVRAGAGRRSRHGVPASEQFAESLRRSLVEAAESGTWFGTVWDRIKREGIDDPDVWMNSLARLSCSVLGLCVVVVHGWVDNLGHRFGAAQRSYCTLFEKIGGNSSRLLDLEVLFVTPLDDPLGLLLDGYILSAKVSAYPSVCRLSSRFCFMPGAAHCLQTLAAEMARRNLPHLQPTLALRLLAPHAMLIMCKRWTDIAVYVPEDGAAFGRRFLEPVLSQLPAPPPASTGPA